MQAHPLDLRLRDKTHQALVIGYNGVVLNGSYDPDQYWFDFMKGAVIRAPIVSTTSAAPISRAKPRDTKWARVPDECKQLYVYEKGIEQHVLPFPDHRKVSNTQYGRLHRSNFLTWERSTSGTLCWILFHPQRRAEVEKWSEQNCTRRFHIKADSAVYESKRDACLAKLMFDDERRWRVARHLP